MRRFYFLFIIIMISAGCTKTLIGEDPANTPENNFEIFWNDYNNYYAQFKLRHINWDSVYTLYRPQITATTTSKQLFQILSQLIYTINDMHVDLVTNFGYVHFKSPAFGRYPSSIIINGCNYLTCKTVEYEPMDDYFGYLDFRNYNLGFILIKTFEGEPTSLLTLPDSNYNFIDNILSQYKNKDGIIIDVRNNPGGVIFNSQIIAGRFANQLRLYEKYTVKNGTGTADFSPWFDMYISPAGPYQYSKPVIILTSRATSSTAECFVLAMKTFPQVITVGDTTGGGFGLPIIRVLPNGWTYRISTAIGESVSDVVVDGQGISPDVPVQTSLTDSIQGVDRILEKGIETIENSIMQNK